MYTGFTASMAALRALSSNPSDPACKKRHDNNMIQVAKKHSSRVQDDEIDTTPQATVFKDITDWRTLVAHSFPGSNKRCPTNIHHQEALVDSYQL